MSACVKQKFGEIGDDEDFPNSWLRKRLAINWNYINPEDIFSKITVREVWF